MLTVGVRENEKQKKKKPFHPVCCFCRTDHIVKHLQDEQLLRGEKGGAALLNESAVSGRGGGQCLHGLGERAFLVGLV